MFHCMYCVVLENGWVTPTTVSQLCGHELFVCHLKTAIFKVQANNDKHTHTHTQTHTHTHTHTLILPHTVTYTQINKNMHTYTLGLAMFCSIFLHIFKHPIRQ